MIETREKMDQIIQEIESPEKKSGKQIGERILKRKVNEKETQIPNISLEIEQLKEFVDANNQLYAMTTELEEEKNASFIKRLYIKICMRLLRPAMGREIAFHASVTRSVNHLYNTAVLVQQFVDEQGRLVHKLEEELRQQQYYNAANEEKIRDLYRRLEQLGVNE